MYNNTFVLHNNTDDVPHEHSATETSIIHQAPPPSADVGIADTEVRNCRECEPCCADVVLKS